MSQRRHSIVNDETEGDRICRMVLELVRELARTQQPGLDVVRGVEPTGVTYAPEMRPFVEQRSDRRKKTRAA